MTPPYDSDPTPAPVDPLAKSTEKLRQEVALFRYGLIADLAQLPPGARGLYDKLRDKAAKDYVIPGSRRRRVAPETLRGWLRDYRRDGFEALLPKARGDVGRARHLPQVVVDLLCEAKAEDPTLSVPLVIKEVRKSHPEQVPADLPLPTSTVHRLLARRGLTGKTVSGDAGGKDRRRFEFEDAGELWMCDVMHGPRVRAHGRKRKAYLIAFLDDATRLVAHSEFTLSEGVAAFLPVFEKAVRKRGLPKRLYVDNGAAFRSHQLRVACAVLGIVLIHARPYSPQGKGKIERWFRTVRLQLLPTLQPDDLVSLEALNRRLFAWVETEYHRAPHRGIGNETPADRWARTAGHVRMAPADVAACFRIEQRRRVAKDRTVTLDGVLFEVDAALVGQTVTLRFDPSRAPRERTLEVLLDGKGIELVKPLDAYSNCFVKRTSSRTALEFAAEASPVVPEGLAMRELDDEDPREIF